MSEAALIWGLSAALAAAIVVPYAVGFRRRRRSDQARKEEAVRLGVDKPAAQFPYVDPRACIGCGSCVSACPEGDVLAVVGGSATVVNGLKCVGHGRCELACPVGAIKVGLGDVKSRADMPLLDDWNETSVPGLFIAGELGGLALIRNAVGQGRRVIERIARRATAARAGAGGDVRDVVIVGAGPAGAAAAATARELGLSHVVLEREASLGGTIFHYPRRKLVLVQEVELPAGGRLKESEYSKEHVLAVFEDLVRRSRLEIRFGEAVTSVSREDGLFSVGTRRGGYRAHFVVLAMGRRGAPRKLGVPGEELPKVTYQLVDAESYRDQRMLVVGGGDSAVEAAIGLARQPGNRVTLSYRREKLVRIKRKNEERLARLVREGRVRTLFPSEVAVIEPQAVRLRVGDASTSIRNDYVLVCAGGEPPLPFLRQIGIRFGGQAAPPAGATAGGR
jgi:thioredoxin reductase/NAD-dependent dihydropyrimidine dehydrogenase PreA subunit